jgi:AcrR family transcriptional regulator
MGTRNDDRRAQRSRRLLRAALFDLIREQGYEPLTVQDIVERADVGRATFYAHFDNKEDLLLSGLDELRESLKRRQRQAHSQGTAGDEHLFVFSGEFLAHAAGGREMFGRMIGRRSGAVIEQAIRRMLLELVREDVKAALPRHEGAATASEATVQFVAGALFGLLMWWLTAATLLSVEEVNALFRQLAVAAVRSAPR